MTKTASDPFVPFGPGTFGARSGAPSPNLKVVPKEAGAESFSPFSPNAGGHAHGAAGAGQPTITLQKEGDRVVGIRVECGCGQVIELACSY